MRTNARHAMESLKQAVESLLPLAEPVVVELEELKAAYRQSQDTLYNHIERADKAEAELSKITGMLKEIGYGPTYEHEAVSTLTKWALAHKGRVYDDEILHFSRARQAYEAASMYIRRLLINLVKMENEATGFVLFGNGEKPDWLEYHEKINEAILMAAKHINPVPEAPKRLGD